MASVMIHLLGRVRKVGEEMQDGEKVETHSIDPLCGNPSADTFTVKIQYANCPLCLSKLREIERQRR